MHARWGLRREIHAQTAWKELASRHVRGTQRGWREGVNGDGGGPGWADGDSKRRRMGKWKEDLLVERPWKVKVRSLALAKSRGMESTRRPLGGWMQVMVQSLAPWTSSGGSGGDWILFLGPEPTSHPWGPRPRSRVAVIKHDEREKAGTERKRDVV